MKVTIELENQSMVLNFLQYSEKKVTIELVVLGHQVYIYGPFFKIII